MHLCDFPTYDEKLIDKKLEEDMDTVLSIVIAGRAGRNTANIKNRQPIGNMFVKSNKTLDHMFIDIIKEELNIKNVQFKDDVSDFTSYNFKPQLRTLGKKYGKLVPSIGNYLKENDGIKLMTELKQTGFIKFVVDGENIELKEEDVLIETAQMDGYVTENDKNITIVLDTNLSEELLEEGFVREIISKIQTMRKEAEFEVLDKITVYYGDNAKIENIINKNIDQIKEDVLATSIVKGEKQGFSKDWNINGENVCLSVVKN